MTVLLSLVAALTSLLILPGWFYSYDVVPKAFVVLAGSAAVIARGTLARGRVAILIAAQIAAIMLAAIFSTHRNFALEGSLWRRDGVAVRIAILLLCLAAARHFAAEPDALRTFLRITVAAAAPVAIYGVLQYFGIDPLLDPAQYHVGEGALRIVRPPSTLGHADYFGTFLLYAIFAGAALALRETSRAWRAVALATCGIATFALVLSGTRAALLGLVIGAIWALVRRTGTHPLPKRWLAAGLAAIALVAIFYVTPAGGKLRARVHWSSEDVSGGGRPLLWRDSLRMATDRPAAGFGPETFPLEFPRYQSVALARANPDFYHESPHNIFLDSLVSTGALGFIPFVALVVLGLGAARGALGGAFVAMLVSQQFTVFTIPTELFFYLTLAILFARATTAAPRVAIAQWAVAIALAAVAVHLATGDALLSAARRALDAGDVDTAARRLDRAHAWGAHADVGFSRLFLTRSKTLAADQRLRAYLYAIQLANRAPDTAEDRQNALVNLAAFRAVQNDAAATERALRDAIAAAPAWFKPHWLLAQVLARAGRIEEARKEAATAIVLDADQHPEVARVFQNLQGR
jgi:O-antigen ligase